MSKLKKTESQENAEELIQEFAAAGNFPKERAGVLALAQALSRAAKDFGLTMQAIVQACSECSQWCPTPHELRNMAMSVRDSIRSKNAISQHAKWDRMYGSPDPDWSANLLKVGIGDSHSVTMAAMHDFSIRCMLFYTEGDGSEFGDREFWEQARALDLRDHAEKVQEIRERGGWQTERDLQQQRKPAQIERLDVRMLAAGDE